MLCQGGITLRQTPHSVAGVGGDSASRRYDHRTLTLGIKALTLEIKALTPGIKVLTLGIKAPSLLKTTSFQQIKNIKVKTEKERFSGFETKLDLLFSFEFRFVNNGCFETKLDLLFSFEFRFVNNGCFETKLDLLSSFKLSFINNG